jgi:hypothetical protein
MTGMLPDTVVPEPEAEPAMVTVSAHCFSQRATERAPLVVRTACFAAVPS